MNNRGIFYFLVFSIEDPRDESHECREFRDLEESIINVYIHAVISPGFHEISLASEEQIVLALIFFYAPLFLREMRLR